MKFDLIYADPPWEFKSNSDDNPGRNVRKEYPTMSIEEIKSLSVKNIAMKNSMLVMWTTSSNLKYAADVMKAWGFDMQSTLFIWIKLNKDGSIFNGMGYHTRKNGELCLYGKRGDGIGRPYWKNISEIIMAERGRHSEKPVEAYERLELMYPDTTKIELFARQRREGWYAWGNEVQPDIRLHFQQSLVSLEGKV